MDTEVEQNLAREMIGKECSFIIGADEAGRGPLAGPVSTAAVCIKVPAKNALVIHELLNDSKLMKESARNVVFRSIIDTLSCDPDHVHAALRDGKSITKVKNPATAGLIGISTLFESANRIDDINILNASLEGMCRCVANLVEELRSAGVTRANTAVFIDGNHVPWGLLDESIREAKLAKQQRQKRTKVFVGETFAQLENFRARGIVGGDRKCASIAAASVIAKVTRDEFAAATMSTSEPLYEFGSHKGYPTPRHMELLSQHGPGQFHRRTFRPVIEASKKRKESKKSPPVARKKKI